jgi:predicted GNAT superfamily acetyltransferase
MARVIVRALRAPAEFRQAQEVARRAWGWPDRDLPPITDLVATAHVGGVVAGAFEGQDMLGFVTGLPRVGLGEPCLHSHMLAVVPEAQGRGLAVRLKLFQRRFCLDRGVRLVTWTYDPLLVKNAALNLNRLRARATTYVRDFYGPMGGIYHGLPTDRFEVRWRLDAQAVARAATGRAPLPQDWAALPRAEPRRLPRERRLVVEVPSGAPALYARDPEAALRARLELRQVAERLFARGYAATAVRPGPQQALYLFER